MIDRGFLLGKRQTIVYHRHCAAREKKNERKKEKNRAAILTDRPGREKKNNALSAIISNDLLRWMKGKRNSMERCFENFGKKNFFSNGKFRLKPIKLDEHFSCRENTNPRHLTSIAPVSFKSSCGPRLAHFHHLRVNFHRPLPERIA